MLAYKVTIAVEDEHGFVVHSESVGETAGGLTMVGAMELDEADKIYEAAFQAARDLYDKMLDRK